VAGIYLASVAGHAAAAECPNEVFRTGQSALLPDCRAYEQATPVDKNGGGAEGTVGVVKAASTGDGITYFSQAGIPGGVGAQEFPSFMATRTGPEWETHGLLPPQSLGNKANVRGVSRNLRYVVTEVSKSGVAPEEREFASLLIEDTVTHQVQTIVPYTEAGLFAFVSASISDDGSYVFFEAKVPLGTSFPLGRQNLFMWKKATGEVSLVGVAPEGEEPLTGSFAGPYNWILGAVGQGGAYANYYVSETNAISENGNRAFFTARTTGQLYLREGLTGVSPSTVHVSASRKAAPPEEAKPAAFVAATPDGSRAFFMSQEELTEDANTGSAEEGNDLYLYEADGGALSDLTAFESAETETLNGAEVQGVLGISRSGSVAYFVANGVLAPGASAGNCSVLQTGGGTCNLYRYDAEASPRITFITNLNGPRFGGEFELGSEARNWSPTSINLNSFLTEPTARVSENGDVLLFRSSQSLTGYDNRACDSRLEGTGEGSEEPCPELYRYSALTGALDCVSCDPSGSLPVGPASLRTVKVNTFVSGKAGKTLPTMTRNLSSDGDQVFFETPDALVPGDVNGESGCELNKGSESAQEASCQDVYEWEAQGSGSCVVPTVPGGCIYLISSGQSAVPANLADVDPSGANVYFFTESQLVPADRDGLVDIYDASIGGGLDSQQQAVATECVGEACQGSPVSPPNASNPARSAISGFPNAKAKHPTKHKKKHKKKKGKHKKKHGSTCKKGNKCKSHPSDQRNARSTRGNQGGVR
jgi:hypothetical protein